MSVRRKVTVPAGKAPSLVIAGRYLTSSGLTDDVRLVTPIADLLIEMARKRR